MPAACAPIPAPPIQQQSNLPNSVSENCFTGYSAVVTAETIALRDLVEHNHHVESTTTLEKTHKFFRERTADFLAVLKSDSVVGLCSRSQVGFLLGSRFGFALNSNRPVLDAISSQSLVVQEGSPIRQVLEAAFNRDSEAFYDDIILVDRAGGFIGLISARKLVQLQSRLVADQMAELHRQYEAARRQNCELFQVNNALRQSQALYRALFESQSLGIALLDSNGVLQTSNQRLGELLNFGSSSSPGGLSIVERLQERDLGIFMETLSTHEKTPTSAPVTREYVLDIPSKGPRRFRITTGWITETGQVSTCFDDVTEQRSLEMLMVRHEKQLLLDTMVGGIAHELNNKLTPVLGFAELLRIESDQRVRYCAQNIGRGIEEAAHIIRQLLQLAKPETNNFIRMDLRKVLIESITMMTFKIRDSGCTVRTSDPAKPVPVLGDISQLKQVVINLVINALQAMESSATKILDLRIETREAEALLIVSDSGAGIPREVLGRIFDPFFTTKGPDRGTGLGLSICSSIMRQHDGDIAVESEPGKGAKFTLVLPLEATETPESLHPSKTQSKSPFRTYEHAQILAVDDEGVLRGVLQEMLRSCFRCKVDVAQNGAEALAAIAQKHYDLIVSDIRMPVMDGPELYTQLKQNHPAAAKRFVFITGYAGDKKLEKMISEWGVPVITKPFRLNRLSEVCFPYLVNSHPAKQLDLGYTATV